MRKLNFIVFLLLFFLSAKANSTPGLDYSNNLKTIQFDVKSLLNARVVTTIRNGELITWNKGIDGSWSGLATRSAADAMGSKDKIAFPDNGIFQAGKFNPQVVLNFSNKDAAGNQVRFTDKNVADSYSFNVTENLYSNISLFFMSAFGTSNFTVEITYSDKTSEVKKYSLEDWATRFPENEAKYFLSANLAKWGDKNTELEKDNHYLAGINIMPSQKKKVVKITINKPASETTFTFWGASGYCAASDSYSMPGNSPAVSYEGRTFNSTDGAARLGFPGIITRVKFRGTDLKMHTHSDSDELYLDVSIDGSAPVFLKVPKGESDVVLAKGLKAGEHNVAIHKRVESCVGILDIMTFTVTGEFLAPPPLPERRLMFMGDSFTCGQAATVEDGVPMDPDKAMRENARLSYGRLLADRLNAQCHILGYAGRGLVRDWQGATNVRCFPEIYEYALPDDVTTLWDPTAYIPDAIGVCVGMNDFDIGVPDQVEYINSYVEFVRKLRRDAPDAHIFLITAPSLTDEPGKVPMRTVQKAYSDEIAIRLGDPRIHVVQIASYPGVPGDGHPDGAAHRAVADELEPLFRKALNW